MVHLCPDFVTCEVCGGSKEDPHRAFGECRHCAGKGEHPQHVSALWDARLHEYKLVIHSVEADPNEAILFARCVGAECDREMITAVFMSGKDLDGKDLPREPRTYSERMFRQLLTDAIP